MDSNINNDSAPDQNIGSEATSTDTAPVNPESTVPGTFDANGEFNSTQGNVESGDPTTSDPTPQPELQPEPPVNQ